MYLEERVEQLEQSSVQQGRQLETVARGLADLTVDVRVIRRDMTEGFAKNQEQFAQVNQRLDNLQAAQ